MYICKENFVELLKTNEVTMRKLICFSLGILFIASFANCSNAQNRREETSQLKEMKSEKIVRNIEKGKTIAYVNTIFEGDLDFSQAGEPSVSSISHATTEIHQDIFFYNCVFLGNVSTNGKLEDGKTTCRSRFEGNVCFSECDFRKEVDFSEAVVKGNLSFEKSMFHAKTSFNGILVEGVNAQFYEIEATENFDFASATIRGNLNFMDAKFNKRLNFSGLNVRNVNLNNLEVEKRFALSESVVEGILQINYANFKDECQLSFSRFADRVEIRHSAFEKLFSVEMSHFTNKVNFSNSKFADSLITKNAVFWMPPEMKDIERTNPEPIYVEVKSSNTILISQ